MRDPDKYTWCEREHLHIPRHRPAISEAVIGWCIGLFVFWTVIWICFR